jgi:uncharacterized protein
MLKSISLNLIRFYQKEISPRFGGHCRYEPTCSDYAQLAIMRYGVIKGWHKTIKRVLSCRIPYGGIDYP